jgi:hypothetical protein
MLKMSRIAGLILAVFVLSMATERPLIAYTDPGSGAMFVQILLAAILGGLFRIRGIFSRLFRGKNQSESVTFLPLQGCSTKANHQVISSVGQAVSPASGFFRSLLGNDRLTPPSE